ncbi:MAG: hypothetical protein ACQEWW_26435 [Bacillota bacterium]
MPSNWVKFVEVTLESIYCDNVGSDVGNDLEINGLLSASVSFFDNQGLEQLFQGQIKELWKVNYPQVVKLYQGTSLTVGVTGFFMVFPNTHIKFGGALWEDDSPLTDDFMGYRFHRFFYNELNENFYPYHALSFYESHIGDQHVRANIKITYKGATWIPPIVIP